MSSPPSVNNKANPNDNDNEAVAVEDRDALQLVIDIRASRGSPCVD